MPVSLWWHTAPSYILCLQLPLPALRSSRWIFASLFIWPPVGFGVSILVFCFLLSHSVTVHIFLSLLSGFYLLQGIRACLCSVLLGFPFRCLCLFPHLADRYIVFLTSSRCCSLACMLGTCWRWLVGICSFISSSRSISMLYFPQCSLPSASPLVVLSVSGATHVPLFALTSNSDLMNFAYMVNMIIGGVIRRYSCHLVWKQTPPMTKLLK